MDIREFYMPFALVFSASSLTSVCLASLEWFLFISLFVFLFVLFFKGCVRGMWSKTELRLFLLRKLKSKSVEEIRLYPNRMRGRFEFKDTAKLIPMTL